MLGDERLGGTDGEAGATEQPRKVHDIDGENARFRHSWACFREVWP